MKLFEKYKFLGYVLILFILFGHSNMTMYAAPNVSYTTGGAFDISSYTSGTNIVLDISNEDTIPKSILFNSDGSILYVVGENGDDINAYPLGEVNYSETTANNGAIDNTNPRDIILQDDTFTGVNGSDFVADGKVTLSNVPAGLISVVTRTSDTRLRVSFTGTATNNESSDTVINIRFTFINAVFTTSTTAEVENAIDGGDTGMTFEVTPQLGGLEGDGRYPCRDTEALNYETSGSSRSSLCKYDTVEEITPEITPEINNNEIVEENV